MRAQVFHHRSPLRYSFVKLPTLPHWFVKDARKQYNSAHVHLNKTQSIPQIYEGSTLSHYIDGSDESCSSWMRFIRCARHKGEQNLYAFQFNGNIYYRAFKDIPTGTELLVWYDDKYPMYMGIPFVSAFPGEASSGEILGQIDVQVKAVCILKASHLYLAQVIKTGFLTRWVH